MLHTVNCVQSQMNENMKLMKANKLSNEHLKNNGYLFKTSSNVRKTICVVILSVPEST